MMDALILFWFFFFYVFSSSVERGFHRGRLSLCLRLFQSKKKEERGEDDCCQFSRFKFTGLVLKFWDEEERFASSNQNKDASSLIGVVLFTYIYVCTNAYQALVRHNQHILRINLQTLLIRHLDRLRIRRGRIHPLHAPRIDVRVEFRLDLKEINHDLRRLSIAIDEAQLTVTALLQIIRKSEQGSLVLRMRPRGVGFSQRIRLARHGRLPVAQFPIVERANGAVAHAQLIIGVVPRRSGRGGGEVDFVPCAPFHILVGGCPGGQGAVEAGVEGDVRLLACGDGDAAGAAGAAGGGCGDASAGALDGVADWVGAGVLEGDGGGGGSCCGQEKGG